jgi:type II secretory ATPase GspE/PulE/Tfp pilus assembly ATPase PilB-like protein
MIVGEIRNKEEAEALFDVLLAGQARGSYATVHAQSAKEALTRLASFGVSRMDMRSIDCIVVQRRMLLYDSKTKKSREVRRVVEIATVDEEARSIFSYDAKKDRLFMGKVEELHEHIANKLGMSRKEVSKELDEREKFIRKSEIDFSGFFSSYQTKFYGGS